MNITEYIIKDLSEALKLPTAAGVMGVLEELTVEDAKIAILRLESSEQEELFKRVSHETALKLCRFLPNECLAQLLPQIALDKRVEILEKLRVTRVSAILHDMPEQLIGKILAELSEETAIIISRIMSYTETCAGGLMDANFLAYTSETTVQQVLNDLRRNRERYTDFPVQYFYVTSETHDLLGVIRVHDLLFPPRDTPLKNLMRDAISVDASSSLTDISEFFDEHSFLGVPVVEQQRIVGIIRPQDIEDALSKQESRRFLRFSGIIGGEEFRTMPTVLRSGRRLSWLTLNIVLNLIAASVIAGYQDTLSAVIVLAVFLPMVSDMSGCSGNQAVAVSMREISLKLIRPTELFWVLMKEAKVGVLNGVVLGVLLGSIAYFWQGNPWIGFVVGTALAINTLVAVMLGGMLPLILQKFKVDPALVSSPILTTVTDMCGFFLVLSLASALLPRLL